MSDEIKECCSREYHYITKEKTHLVGWCDKDNKKINIPEDCIKCEEVNKNE